MSTSSNNFVQMKIELYLAFVSKRRIGSVSNTGCVGLVLFFNLVYSRTVKDHVLRTLFLVFAKAVEAAIVTVDLCDIRMLIPGTFLNLDRMLQQQ